MLFTSARKGGIPSISSTTATTTLLLLLTQIFAPALAADCSQYSTTGPSGDSTYNNYAFYDFRNLQSQLSGTPQYDQDMDFNNPQFGLSTSAYFNNTPWTDHWSISNATKLNNVTLSQYVPMVYTALNVGIVKDNSTVPDGDTLLSLTTNRLDSYSATAQINTNQLFMHASARISARMMGPPGACGAFFLYGDDNNESDIELLTNDTGNNFHATNHPSQDSRGFPIPGTTTDTVIPLNGSANGTTTGSWSDWNEWRIDWLPTRTDWIINGDLVITKTINVPKIPGYLGINMWSNGGTWTGNMTVGDTATLQIRWIEIAYNTTSDNVSGSSVCTVGDNNDGNNNLGNVNAAVTSAASSRTFETLLAWSTILGTTLWLSL